MYHETNVIFKIIARTPIGYRFIRERNNFTSKQNIFLRVFILINTLQIKLRALGQAI